MSYSPRHVCWNHSPLNVRLHGVKENCRSCSGEVSQLNMSGSVGLKSIQKVSKVVLRFTNKQKEPRFTIR